MIWKMILMSRNETIVTTSSAPGMFTCMHVGVVVVIVNLLLIGSGCAVL